MKLGTSRAREILNGEKPNGITVAKERHRKCCDTGETFGKVMYILHGHITTECPKPGVEIFDISFLQVASQFADQPLGRGTQNLVGSLFGLTPTNNVIEALHRVN